MVCMACQAPAKIYMTVFEHKSCDGPNPRHVAPYCQRTNLKGDLQKRAKHLTVLQNDIEASIFMGWTLKNIPPIFQTTASI